MMLRVLSPRRALGAIALLVPLALPGGPLRAQEPAANRPVQTSSPLLVDRIAAVVGTKVILVSDIEAALIAQGVDIPTDSAERVEMQRGVLEQLIDMEVLVQRAEADTSLFVDGNEIERMADAQITRVRANFAGDQEYRAALVEAGFGSPEEYRQRQIEDFRRRSLQEAYMGALRRSGKYVTVNVSEREVNTELAKFEGRLPERAASVGFQQIVIPTLPGEESRQRARALIDSLYLALRNRPSNFEEVARTFSQDASAEQGGDLGWNRRGAMVPEFDRVMFMINPGVVSPPVESRYGWHLIRVDRVQPAEVKARHILIKAAVDSADVERSRVQADSVRLLWERGTAFDSLRQRFHDERNGEDAIIPEIGTADLPEAYSQAIGQSAQGTIVGPFAVEDQVSGSLKWIVLRLTRVQPAGTMTLEEARRDLRARMQEAYSLRRLLDSMRKQTYVSVRF